ncbi:MAG: DMT family transporter [Desulfobacteraceae bacterium]|nr:DMT family transporter [Desulfobacteraceae bacterium]
MMKTQLFSYMNLALAMVIVGSSVVVGKIVTFAFPVFLASGLRFGIACIVMLPVLARARVIVAKIDVKLFLRLLLMAFCGQFIFTFLLLLGLRYTSGIEAGLITSTSPAVISVASFLMLGEKPGKRQIAAVILVILGIISMNGLFTPQGLHINRSHLTGNLIVLGAVFGEAFFLMMRKRIPSEISNIELTAILSFLGFAMFLPFSIYQGLFFDFAGVSNKAWLAMLYLGAIFTVLSYYLWFKGVEKVSGNTAGVFTACMPMSAVALSCLFLKESLSLYHVVGGILILFAIFMTFLDRDMFKGFLSLPRHAVANRRMKSR